MVLAPHDGVKDTESQPAGPGGVSADLRVDSHFHVFPRLPTAPAGARYVPGYAAGLEDWSVAAAAHGVAAGVLVQPSFLGTDNTVLLRALAGEPRRLRGIGVLDPGTDARALAELEAAGMRGVRLNLVGRDHRIDAAQAALLERIGAIGWHVEVHVDAGRLAEVLAQLPAGLEVVADHFGKPGGADDAATWAAARRRRDTLHVKLSAPYRLAAGLEPGALARRWCDEVGPHRLLWGSDWPNTNHEGERARAQSPAVLAQWLGDESVARRALCDNPWRLYRFGEAG